MITLIKNAKVYAPKEIGLNILVVDKKIKLISSSIPKNTFVNNVYDAEGKIDPGFIINMFI